MRFLVTMQSGRQWVTDFESGQPIRDPDGDFVESTVIAARWHGHHNRHETPEHVALHRAATESIQDRDCG